MSLSQNDLDWLAARLSIAVYDTNQDTNNQMSTRDLINAVMAKVPGKATVASHPSGSGEQLVTVGNKTLKFSPMASNEEIVAALLTPTVPTQNTKVTVTTALDRLKGKFVQARGVAQRVATNMEAEADSLIAQEDAMKSKTASAFAPHHAILAEAGNELKAIEDALNLMSNGGPPLDPLPDAGATAAGSKTA